MGFKCGLVGLPNAGKSTIFNAITNLHVDVASYPFCTIDPHFGMGPLDDPRLDFIQKTVESAKKTPNILEFIDIAGLVKGANQGEGLGNQFLSHIGQADAICHVIRCFEDENVSHPYGDLNPVRDAEDITLELILKDTEWVEKRIAKNRVAAKSGNTEPKKMVAALEPILDHLNGEKEVRTLKLNEFQQQCVREMNLLTAKPVLFIANVDENHVSSSPLVKSLEQYSADRRAPCVSFCGKVQAEIAELSEEDQLEFLQAMGLDETGLQKIVNAGFQALDLITYFTANENEARGWTLQAGTPVVKAAGQIHTDFEAKFIKAEVVKFSDLQSRGSMKNLHDHGLIAVHGKEYLVEDGDLLLFKIQS